MNRTLVRLLPLSAAFVAGVLLLAPWSGSGGSGVQAESPDPTATPYYYTHYPHYHPQVVPTAGPPVAQRITLSVHSISIDCGGVSFITATVRDAGGNYVPDGTTVAFSTTAGTLDPTITQTTGGSITVMFTAPSHPSPPVRFSATAGAATGHASLGLACEHPPQPTPIPTHRYPHEPQIKPPATGDGALAGGSTSSYLGAALIVASLAGAAAVLRKGSAV